MKMKMKTTVVVFVAVAISGGVTARCQDTVEMAWPPTAWAWPGNGFTNQVAVPTVKLYTNTQAAAANDRRYRVREEGTPTKGAAALQSGPRIEPRPPSAYVQADPWVQRDHPWDVNPFLPINASPGDTNSSVIDETKH